MRARILAPLALAAAAIAIAVLLLMRGGGMTYRLVFDNAGQLVNGDQVQVGGVAVGKVKAIDLTTDNRAQVTISVDRPIAPLHGGTTATIRATSLSGVANRYISLSPGPNNNVALHDGSSLPATAAQGIVDIDQLFDTFDPRTRAALQQVIQGSATQSAGAERALQRSATYFSPAISATDHVFAELTRDQSVFTNFLVSTSRAVTTIASRRDQLAGLVANGNTAFGALGTQDRALARALAVLPTTLTHGNALLADLPPALSDLDRLVAVSKADTKTLAPFLAQLRPLLVTAVPAVRDLRQAIDQPRTHKDLLQVVRSLPALDTTLRTASPATVAALQGSAPISSFIRPYAPDLVGWLRDFGQVAAYYDANGHYARVSPVFDSFAPGSDGVLRPVTPQQGIAPLQNGNLRRCPGTASQPAIDGSTPFTDGAKLDCNPSQVLP
jgi:phospholipid/cholesterol/gamma-HCH transport system substrate-binding protein